MTSKIKAGEGTLVELETVIKVSQASRAEAKKAAARQGKAASASDDESDDLAANIDLLTMAIAELEKGVAGSTSLQSRIGSTIRKMAMIAERVSDSDIFTLLTFLSNGDRQQDAPQSGDIVGSS